MCHLSLFLTCLLISPCGEGCCHFPIHFIRYKKLDWWQTFLNIYVKNQCLHGLILVNYISVPMANLLHFNNFRKIFVSEPKRICVPYDMTGLGFMHSLSTRELWALISVLEYWYPVFPRMTMDGYHIEELWKIMYNILIYLWWLQTHLSFLQIPQLSVNKHSCHILIYKYTCLSHVA